MGCKFPFLKRVCPQEPVQQYGQLYQEKADNFPLEAGIIQSVTRQMRMIKNAISATGLFRGNPLLPCQYTLPCPDVGHQTHQTA